MEQKRIRPVDFGRRFSASLIDFVFFIPYAFLVTSMYTNYLINLSRERISNEVDSFQRGGSIFSSNPFEDILDYFTSPMTLFFWVLLVSLFWLPEILNGNSFGKRMIGVLVRRKDGELTTIKERIRRFLFKHSYWLSFFVGIFLCSFLAPQEIRSNYGTIGMPATIVYLPYLVGLSLIILFVFGIGFLLINDEKRQSFEDKASGTSVFLREDVKTIEKHKKQASVEEVN